MLVPPANSDKPPDKSFCVTVIEKWHASTMTHDDVILHNLATLSSPAISRIKMAYVGRTKKVTQNATGKVLEQVVYSRIS